MKKAYLAFLFLIASLFSHSCDCGPFNKFDTLNTNYSTIFKGKVVDTISDEDEGVVTFFVEHLYRGTQADTLRICFKATSSCLMSFAPGEEWIMYCNTDTYNRLYASFCGHSRKFISHDPKLDLYISERGTTFEQEDSMLRNVFINQKFPKSEVEMPERELEHPQRGTAIWYILASIPVLVLIYYFVKRYT